jgi:hypothetical protein
METSTHRKVAGRLIRMLVRYVMPPVMLAAKEFQESRFNRAKYKWFPHANSTIPPSTTYIPPGQAQYVIADPLSITSSVIALVTFAL